MMSITKPIKRKTIYLDGHKWVVLGYTIKEREQQTITVKTDCRGQMNEICDFHKVYTLKIEDTEYKVELKTMCSSNREEWEFVVITDKKMN